MQAFINAKLTKQVDFEFTPVFSAAICCSREVNHIASLALGVI